MTGWYCNSCHEELTPEEHSMYDDRCEKCERAWSLRVTNWRKGGRDSELDDIFSEIRVLP